MKASILLFLTIFGLSCHHEVTPNQLALSATVLSRYTSECGLPLLDFGTEADQIGQLMGYRAKVCSAVHLDQQFDVGDQLTVIIRKPLPNELTACTAMLQSYLAVTVVKATRN